MIFALFRRSANDRVIDRLHGDIMAAVRQSSLYADYGVADTFEGRFEVLSLMVILVVRRLSRLPAPGPDLAQDLTDKLFTELDATMREMGVGDLAVPKRIKKLAAAFLGCRQAYDTALEAGPEALCEALARNIYGAGTGEGEAATPAQVARLGRYVQAVDAALGAMPTEAFVQGPVTFPAAQASI